MNWRFILVRVMVGLTILSGAYYDLGLAAGAQLPQACAAQDGGPCAGLYSFGTRQTR